MSNGINKKNFSIQKWLLLWQVVVLQTTRAFNGWGQKGENVDYLSYAYDHQVHNIYLLCRLFFDRVRKFKSI